MTMTSHVRLALGLALTALALAAGAQTAERKGYIIQLADDPAASYSGGVAGLAATRPAAGQRFNVTGANVQAYMAYLDNKATALASAAVPNAQIYARYGVALNGFAAQLTDAEVRKLATTPGVVAIMADIAEQIDTSHTPTFLGLTTPVTGGWSRLDGSGRQIKGEDIIIAHVDTGVWPENPSFSDKVDAVTGKPVPYYAAGNVVYGPPPAKWVGTCQTGQGFTAAMCNNKLIGAQYFNAGWLVARPNPSQWWSMEYVHSPRDADGHGSHTLSTSGGNQGVDALVAGSVSISGVSGIAPRARVASYKACYTATNGPGDVNGGCFPSDTLAAINKAVADGVDVINYSIGGSRTSFTDITQTAFRNAALAGVVVSASAGNANTFPGNATTVAHISPWLMTVGNSTHDRYTEAVVTLGANGTVQGASFQTAGLSAKTLIWSRNAGFGAPAAQGSNQALCLGAADGVAALLDPAKVAGKIVVCDRGTNALVNKVTNAKTAGALGVIIQNTTAANNTTPLISAVLPTVHVPVSGFTAVTTEAAANGTAAFGGGIQVAGVVAPVMSNSSSRGPNQADVNILKPDITAPGTDIIAAYAHRGLTQAQRDAIAGGNLAAATPYYEMISGTSMSSPHNAGMAALLRQLNPTWSPWAIKSALMTSATQNVKLANGAADPSPWGYGAGHANPNAALGTTVVYDTTNANHMAYYTGTLPGGSSSLNLASMTRGNAVGTATFTRTLTNKGSVTQTFNATAALAGFAVTVTPSTLTLTPGQSVSFTVAATPTTAPQNAYVFGNVTWTSATNTLRSPLTVRYTTFSGLTSLVDTRAVGTRVWSVATGFSGPMQVTPSGMVPATQTNVAVSTTGPTEQCAADFNVPAGTKVVRAQMFNSETQNGAATDIDLYLYRVVGATRTQVGASESGTTDELISVSNPTAGTYRACAVAFAPVGQLRSSVINTWAVGGPATSLKAFGAANAVSGGTASIGVAWNVAPGARYLGVIEVTNPPNAAVLGSTQIFVDTSAAAAAAAGAVPILDVGAIKAQR
jgi:Subtilase family/Fibronectin type-III domain/PA domain/Peptidase inhibitor I9